MYKIGEFSRFAQVTIDALRHYDKIGLLKPARIDPFTGYRYYSARQLHSVNQILALKSLGFSLEEMVPIVQGVVSDEEIRGMLKFQFLSTKRDLKAAQLRLERIEAHLQSLSLEDSFMTYDVTVKPVEAVIIASIREVVADKADVPERCGAMFSSIANWLKSNQLPIGIPMTIYFNESYVESDVDLECAFTIPNGEAALAVSTEGSTICVRQMDAVAETAVTVVTDDFYKKVDGLTPAYQSLGNWIEANGYQIAGPPRELMYGSPEQGDLTAEIQFPITKS